MTGCNAVIYARYSSSKQTEQSIEGQLRYCNEFAARCGYTIVANYIDRAISGTREDRPEFQQMVKDSVKKQFEVVLVWKFDRFSRNRFDSAIYKNKLKKNGVKVISATESIGDGNESIILEAIFEANAELYSKQLGENAARGMRESALKGYCTGGNIPFGFCVGQDKFLHIDEKQADIVRLIFEMYVAGKGKQQIVNKLNNKGYKTKNNTNWNVNSLSYMLTNKMYIGDYTYKNEIKRTCPAIIDIDTFEKAQEILNKNKRSHGTSPADKIDYLLYGKLFCGYCGNVMVGDCGTSRTGKIYNYYSCSNRKNHNRKAFSGTEKCKKISEKKDYLEWYLVEQTLKYILTPQRIDYIADKVVKCYENEFGVKQIQGLEKALKQLDKDLDKCVDILFNTSMQKSVIDKVNQKAATLEIQKQEIDSQLTTLRIAAKQSITVAQVKNWLQNFCNGDALDIDFQHAIIDVFINSVYLFDDKIIIYYNVQGSKQVTYIEMLGELEQAEFDMVKVRAGGVLGSQFNNCLNVFR